jgi:endonuclease/exonuclease/phosphatase family metal-dependent hydrolase
VKHSLPDPEKIITDIESQLKKLRRRYRTNFFLQQNVVPIFSTVLPKVDFLARKFCHNLRFRLPEQLETTQIIKNKKINQKNKKTLNFVSANILQGVQGVGKEMLFCRFWNSIFFEKFPSPWLEKIFTKDVSQSLENILQSGKNDILALQEVFSADIPEVKSWLSQQNQQLVSESSPLNVFIKKYNVATLMAANKALKMQSVSLTSDLHDLFRQAEKFSWGLNLVELVDDQIFLLNLHAPIVAVRRQLFWKKLTLFLSKFRNTDKKMILMGDFNGSPTEIKKFLASVSTDLFVLDLPTFHMEKPPITMKLDNFVLLGFETTAFTANASTHDIGSDHRALRVELSF